MIRLNTLTGGEVCSKGVFQGKVANFEKLT